MDGIARFQEQALNLAPKTASTATAEADPSTGTNETACSSEEVLDALSRNEDGDALLYRRLHEGRFCYDAAAGRWYQWAGQWWQKDILNGAMRGIDDVVNVYATEAQLQGWQRLQAEKAGRTQEAARHQATETALVKRIRTLQTVSRKENVLTLARIGGDSLGIRGDEWDRNPMLFACQNGIIDLRTGLLRPGVPEDYIKTVAPIEYHGIDTPAVTWDRIVSDVFDGNADVITFVQRFLGYVLTDETIEHVVLIFWGAGRNGKTTLIETVSLVLGAYAGEIESEMLLTQRFGRQSGGPSPDIMALRGRRFIHCSETEDGRHFNVARVKWLSGGDTLTGRDLYGKELVTFRPTHKLVLSTNHRPHTSADDYAFWKRALLIPFTLSFVEDPHEAHERKADPRLLEKLKAEASGILSWMVRGCLEWQRQGLNPPACVKMATQEYRQAEDLLKHFIDDKCVVGPRETVKASDLYAAYRQWCGEMGHAALNGTNFGTKMKGRFVSKREKSGMTYSGVGLCSV